MVGAPGCQGTWASRNCRISCCRCATREARVGNPVTPRTESLLSWMGMLRPGSEVRSQRDREVVEREKLASVAKRRAMWSAVGMRTQTVGLYAVGFVARPERERCWFLGGRGPGPLGPVGGGHGRRGRCRWLYGWQSG